MTVGGACLARFIPALLSSKTPEALGMWPGPFSSFYLWFAIFIIVLVGPFQAGNWEREEFTNLWICDPQELEANIDFLNLIF